MPMTFDGSGTITGLAAGGLPNSSVITADIADAAITAAKLDGAQSGSAPIYGARAWVNFNGTGTVTIRASGNVSSITDNGTGDYTLNFTTAMQDANYSPVCMMSSDATRELTIRSSASDSANPDLMTTSQLRVAIYANSGGNVDVATVCISIFR
jgi:hypothetical protein